jgi:hypothetical protein
MPENTSEAPFDVRNAVHRERIRQKLVAELGDVNRDPRAQAMRGIFINLLEYVSDLEVRAWRGDSDTLPNGDEDRLRQQERYAEQAEKAGAFDPCNGTADMATMLGAALAALEPHAAKLRALSGLLSFRQQAAIGALSSFARWGDQQEIESKVRCAVTYAVELEREFALVEAGIAAKGGAA